MELHQGQAQRHTRGKLIREFLLNNGVVLRIAGKHPVIIQIGSGGYTFIG